MPQQAIFKLGTAKLKNALAAILETAIAQVKRFTTALHNRCNLVVFVDAAGRTCSTFLRRDAFTGYHLEFSGDKCIVTNKESGDVYTVEFGKCSCPAFKYSPKKECKHQLMVAELKGELSIEQAIAQTELDSYIEQQADAECTHWRAITGLDAHYCQASFAEEYSPANVAPDCRKSIEYGTAAYNQMLNKVEKIDTNNLPAGCRLTRTDDHISMEYEVHVWRQERVRGIPTLTMHNIGRIVQMPAAIYAYTGRSGVARNFPTARDAIAYLVRVVGTSFEEIAEAFNQNEQLMRRRIARL